MMPSDYRLLMGKLDALELAIVKGKRRSFWLGWATGVAGVIAGVVIRAVFL